MYIIGTSNIVDIINCNFNVLSTLSKLFTDIKCVLNILTNIHKIIPNAINNNGYIKLDNSNWHPFTELIKEVDEITNAAHVD